ncbi:hypothetical protein CA13_54230 [Planctomycetes bacterium CA13]|uniref:Uncharacterized protein n=1 Tax=Novipirellula herctigrandis TaxID=2527986 RepID=A0A5C5Z9A0_9BACT|nr:hypothetical protein CA13_54230 [Planctomycetes bacterium CA13]
MRRIQGKEYGAKKILFGGGNPRTKLHRLWLLQLRPDQVHDSQSQGSPPSNKTFHLNHRPTFLQKLGSFGTNQEDFCRIRQYR